MQRSLLYRATNACYLKLYLACGSSADKLQQTGSAAVTSGHKMACLGDRTAEQLMQGCVTGCITSPVCRGSRLISIYSSARISLRACAAVQTCTARPRNLPAID